MQLREIIAAQIGQLVLGNMELQAKVAADAAELERLQKENEELKRTQSAGAQAAERHLSEVQHAA